jgi:class 3 adenylate cyclase
MEPRTQYATTVDGVSIALWTLGEGGIPLVLMPWIPFNHIQLNWETEDNRRMYERLARERQIVHYDGRGSGLSDRKPADLSLDTHLGDLEAVLDKLAVRRADLWAFLTSGPVAITFAARHPERVSRLIFWCSFARGTDMLKSPQLQGLLALMEKDWELFTETMASVIFGWSGGESARRFARYMRESVTPEFVRASLPQLTGLDVSDLLPQVTCPALILQRRQMEYPGMEAARLLASRMPNSRLVSLDGESSIIGTDTDTVVAAVEEFLQEGDEALPEGILVILFADIANSTGLTEAMGDSAFREKARRLDDVLRATVRDNAGWPVEGKLLGDGILGVFTSARQAVIAARSCSRVGDEGGLPLHIGLHAGDVIREGHNVYGGAVNIAARIAASSSPGEVLVSDTVRGLARTSVEVVFEDQGERDLKGIGEPLRLWAVRAAS